MPTKAVRRSPKVALLFATLLTVIFSYLAPGVATSQADSGSKQTTEVLKQFDASRIKLRKSISLYKQGKLQEAKRTVVAAYLEHFERAEPPLRVLDPDLTLEIEDRYSQMREAIENDRGISEVRNSAVSINRGLDEFETKLDKPGVAAGGIAFVSSFSIIFREGLEAVLVLVALLGFLQSADKRRYRKPVTIGVLLAVLASVLCFLLTTLILDIAPLQRELLEAITTVIAIVLLFFISFWLLRKIEHRHWMEFIRSRLWGAAARGSVLAVASVGFVSVFREGFETVLFYQALLFYTQSVLSWVVAGFIAGSIALFAIAYVILKLRHKLPIKTFMTAAVSLVMLLSVAFIGNAVNKFQNLDYLPATSLRDDMPRIPVTVAELTGIHPSVESLAAQGGLALIYLIGGTVVFIKGRRVVNQQPQPTAAS